MMRRLIVIAAALAMMLAVQNLGLSSSTTGVDSKTLASIGFVIIAAFSVGGLISELGLPKIIGYILAGISLGPALTDILSVRVVKEMQVFNTLALGLIALGAGLELDLKAIGRVWKTLFSTVLIKVPLLLVLMGGAFLAIHHLRPMLPISDGGALSLALILAVLGIGTSPSVALAVVRETGAKGRLTDILLAMVVVKDLVVIVLLAVAIGVAKTLINPEAVLDATVLVHVGREIGGSVVLGGLIAGLLLLYVRFVHREMLLVIVVVILLAAEVCDVLHLELLLVFITAGFVVRNFSKYEHQVLEPLEKVALPVFVVFFTTAGAALDVNGVLRLLPLGIALVVARTIANIIAARLGGLIGKEQPAVRDNAWLVYVPQAGVTLGLVFLAARSLPSLATEIGSAGMAMVGINLLVGPIFLGAGLKRAGDIPKGQSKKGAAALDDTSSALDTSNAHGATAHETAHTNDDVDTPHAPSNEKAERPRRVVASAPRRPKHIPLSDVHATLHADLESLIQTFVDDDIRRALKEVSESALAHLHASTGPADARGHAIALARRVLEQGSPDPHDVLEPASVLAVNIARTLNALPDTYTATLSDVDLTANDDDTRTIRFAKLMSRVGRRRQRAMRLRVLTRATLDLPIATAVSTAVTEASETEIAIWHELKDVLEGERDAAIATERIVATFERGIDDIKDVFRDALHRGLSELTEIIDLATTPGAKRRTMNLSSVHSKSEAILHSLTTIGQRHDAQARAAFDTVRAEAALFVLEDQLSDVRKNNLALPLDLLVGEIIPEVDNIIVALEELKADVAASAFTPDEIAAYAKRADAILTVRGRGRVRRATARHRRETQANVVLAELMRALPKIPERVALLPSLDRATSRPAPVTIDLMDRVRERLEASLHRLQEINQPVLDVALPFASQLEEAVHVVNFSFEVAARGRETADESRSLVVTAIERTVAHTHELEKTLVVEVQKAGQGIDAVFVDLDAELEDLARVREGAGELMRTSVRATRRLIFARADEIIRNASTKLRRVSGLIANVRARSDVQDYLLRAGRERFDASDMREYLSTEVQRTKSSALPGIYEKLFVLDPLDDARLLVSHKAELERIITLTNRGRALGVARVLVVGDPGSGRTTLFQSILRRLSGVRVIVIDPAYHPRELGVVGAIAEELSCTPDIETVAERLSREPTVVLVDDLERHLPAGARLKVELDEARALLRETAKTTHFVVNTETLALSRFDDLVSLSAQFEHVVRLHALDGERLKDVVERRRRLAGLRLSFEDGGRLFRIGRDTSARLERRYFDRLAHAARGNLRTALLLHLKGANATSDDTVVVERPRALRIPFLRQLSPPSLAVLSVLARTGPLDLRNLSEAMLVDEGEAANLISALLLTGLVVECPAFDATEFTIPSAIASTLNAELSDLGVVERVVR